tara:strand:+ start:4979 stop:7450 length:2472 start_codon:yes stop_codon:yes gene_type:complete
MIYHKIKSYLNHFIKLLGFIFLFLIIIFFFLNNASTSLRKEFLTEQIVNQFKQFAGLKSDYNSFQANTFPEFVEVYKEWILSPFIKKNDFPVIEILTNFKNLKNLENQRIGAIDKNFVKARIKIHNQDNKANEIIKVKVRSKGDRKLHKINNKLMSLKVDVRGEKRFFGLEEFSIQDPIIRNYSWEILLHKLAKKEKLIALEMFPINLIKNGEKLGVFFVEEGFTNELLEKNNRKDGPIIGLDEDVSFTFPTLYYDFYSEDRLIEKMPDIYKIAKNKLHEIKNDYKNESFNLKNFFNLDEWAKLFALTDLLVTYHGMVPKSVKLYYNVNTGLFDPIIFDGHKGGSNYRNFIFLDFVNSINLNYNKCGFVCTQPEWFKIFFNNNNVEFLKKYLKYLEKFSSEKYLKEINIIIDKDLKPINKSLYSTLAPSDRIFVKGFLPYHFDDAHLLERANLIKKKIHAFKNLPININGKVDWNINSLGYILHCNELSIKNEFEFLNENNCKFNVKKNHLSKKKILLEEFSILLKNSQYEKILKKTTNLLNKNNDNSITFPKGIWAVKNYIFKDKNIKFQNGSILLMLDNISMLGGKNDLFVEGEGMIVKLGGTINIENVSFENLSNIKIPGLSWSGAINIINSKLKLKNVKISNTLGEDAINIVNSNSKIKDLLISNVPSDGLDIDFGTSDFSLIRCDNIGNDCLDTSGAKINGDMVSGNKIDDKLISIGEKSALSLNKLLGTNVNIGVAVKDSSIAKIENLFLTRANIDIAVFQKKPFFGPAELTVNNFSGYSSSERNNLVAENNILNINNKLQQTSGNSLEIEKLLYAN